MTADPNPFASPQSYSPPIVTEGPFATEFPAEMRRVRIGLSLVYYGICGILLTAITMPFVVGFAVQGGGQDAGFLTLIMGGLMIAFGLMMFGGQVMCISVPEESGAKGLVLASVVLQAFSLLMSLALAMVAVGAAGSVASGIGNLLGVVSMVCFVLFLRQTAIYIHRTDIAGRAVRTLIVGIVAMGLLIAGGIAMFLVINNGNLESAGVLPGALMTIGGLASLVALIMYANTVTYLRNAIKV